jgi:type IV secretory pathway VirB10-like protein
MRSRSVLLAVAICTLAAIVATIWLRPEAARTPKPLATDPPVQASGAASASSKPLTETVTVAPRAPETRAPAVAPPVAPPAPLPVRKSEIPTAIPNTPQIEASLYRLGSNAREILTYKLGLLDRLRLCLGPDEPESGTLELFFFFDMDEARTAGTAQGFQLDDSTVGKDDDARISKCLESAHHGQTIALPSGIDGPRFHWATTIKFPLENDFAVEFIRTDGQNLH